MRKKMEPRKENRDRICIGHRIIIKIEKEVGQRLIRKRRRRGNEKIMR
jgi:hypothetical protein